MSAAAAHRLIVKNPWNDAELGSFAFDDEQSAQAALDRAHRWFMQRDNWPSAAERKAILGRFLELARERFDELVGTALSEGGKPRRDTVAEVKRGLNGVELAIEALSSLHGTEIPMGLNEASLHRFAHTYREPRGVVLAISAFNHPFNLTIHQVITAVAAGCPVIIKPASTTPMSCMRVVELLHEAGLPKDACQVLLLPGSLTEPLVRDPRVAFLSFIGSAKVGWHLRSQLAPGATCALEHGGVAPVIIEKSADLQAAIPRLVKGGFYHAGQVCVSVQRIYIPKGMRKSFVEPFVAQVQALVTGDPNHEGTDVGPLISTGEVERVHRWVKAAVAGKAECLCGGEPLSRFAYAPTVLLNPPEDCEVSTQEVFGPVVAVYEYDDLEEAVARANQLDVDFQASVFTRDLDTALGVSRRLQAMAVMINDHTAFRVDWMPFGGHRNSGLGVGGIEHTIRDMTLERLVVFHSPAL